MKSVQHIHPANRQRGFTLIELMVTISVTALLLSIAVPSFRDMAIRNQLSGYANDVIAAINYARSEAIRRGKPISICKSDDGASCSGDWNDGWIVFVNEDGESPATVDGPDDLILKASGALTNQYTMGADAALANDITYGSDGAATATGMLTICYDDELVGARAIVVTPLRPRVATDTDGDRIPNRDDTENVGSCAAPGG